MQKHSDKVYLILFALAAVGLGFWGYASAGADYTPYATCMALPVLLNQAHDCAPHAIAHWLSLEALRCLISAAGMIRLVDLFQPGQDPWQLILAQAAIPGIALVSAARLFLAGVRKNFITVMARRKFDHAIVCGIGDVGMQVIENLQAEGAEVVAIDLVDDSPAAATCEKSGVPLLRGDAKNQQVLLAAGLRQARTVILTTGSDSENLDVAMQIRSIQTAQSGRSLQVLVQVRNDWMHKRLMASGKLSLGTSAVDLRLFNPFTDAARMLVQRVQLLPVPEFEAETFAIVGFGAYGREIALQLILSFPVRLGRTLKIIVIDAQAETAGATFHRTNPRAADLASFQFLTATVAPGSADLSGVVEPALTDAGPLLGVTLALGDDEISLCAALEMRSLLDRLGRLHTPVYVRLEHYRQLGDLVSEIESAAAFRDRLTTFGTLEETLGLDVLIGSRLDSFAQALHEDYRLRSCKTGTPEHPKPSASLTVTKQGQRVTKINPQADHPWHKLPELLKMSNRWRADHTPVLLQLAGIRMQEGVANATALELSSDEIELLAQMEHRRYLIERFLTGRRQMSQRPNLEDWERLSDAQREWNRREIAHVPAIMAVLGMQLSRARTLPLYGEDQQRLEAGLNQAMIDSKAVHWDILVDLDDTRSVSLACRALTLPSRSFWLISDAEPGEFFVRKLEENLENDPKPKLVHAASGWKSRDLLNRPLI